MPLFLSKPILYLALAGVVIALLLGAFLKVKNLGKMEERARQLSESLEASQRGRTLRNSPIRSDEWLS